jgi:phosphoribosylglycinamide formyltransferase 1
MDLKLGFLASGSGSNVEAILRNIDNKKLVAEPKIIITNNSDAGVLDVASRYAVKGICINNKNKPEGYDYVDDAILDELVRNEVNMVVLGGYMKMVGPRITRHYRNKILNIHPGPLPKYGGAGMYGLHVHQAVIDAGEKFSGPTVHLADEQYDHGRILRHCPVEVYPTDTAESLASRILFFEWAIYSSVLKDIQEGKICLDIWSL